MNLQEILIQRVRFRWQIFLSRLIKLEILLFWLLMMRHYCSTSSLILSLKCSHSRAKNEFLNFYLAISKDTNDQNRGIAREPNARDQRAFDRLIYQGRSYFFTKISSSIQTKKYREKSEFFS